MAVDYHSIRDSALSELQKYMDSLDPEKGTKLAYWVRDYARFLAMESSFKPEELIRYKRGAIVKVHLGYRVGSEEGGLHYAIVMDKNSSIYSPTLTVIPLTSIKPGVDLSKLPPAKLSLGDEIHTILSTNLTAEIRSAKQHLKDTLELAATIETDVADSKALKIEDAVQAQLKEINQQIDYCERMKREIQRMKTGSIALVGQITTVSKIRIYNPKYKKDALSKIRVSAATLDMLDERIKLLFTTPPRST